MIIRYIIFATHMKNLAELATLYPNVKILHFDVDVNNNRLDFKVPSPMMDIVHFILYICHTWSLVATLTTDGAIIIQFLLKDGSSQVPHYGLLLAQVAGLPTSVIETARTITTQITEKVNLQSHVSISVFTTSHLVSFTIISVPLQETQRVKENCQLHSEIQIMYHVGQMLINLAYANQDEEESLRYELRNLKERLDKRARD